MSLHVRIHFDMCIAFHLSTLPFSPYSIFTSKHIKKSILNSMSKSILAISIQPQRDSKKKTKRIKRGRELTRSMSSSPFIHIPNDCGCQFIQCQQRRGRCVSVGWWGGVGQGHSISPKGDELSGTLASWHRCPPSPAGPASVPYSIGLRTERAWGGTSTHV